MFCKNCGKQIDDYSLSCQYCGAEQTQSVSSHNILADVQFKSNGKSAQFFDDHIEFYGKSFRYDDIKTLITRGATTIHTYIGIPVGRSFDGVVQFKLNNGKTHHINMNAMNIFGIGKARKNEKLFPPLFNAVYSIVAKRMAEKQIDMIRAGATVEVAGLTINSLEATSKSKVSKKVVVINKENYRESHLINGSGVIVYDKPGEILWSSSMKNSKNVLLVPYILDTIFS